jgi:flagellar basal body-associated protein FliL
MSEKSEEQARRKRLRWISLGEAIAISALVISGLGLWREWRKDDSPSATTTTVIEKRQAIPLSIRS